MTKTYDIDFKKTLVDLYQSGQSVASTTLYKWIDSYSKDEKSGVSNDEFKQLKREIAKLKEQNEILKEAIIIFTSK
jgi:transposase